MEAPAKKEERRDYEDVVRTMITREDELTNQRMLWNAAFNGLLFASLGFAWGKPDARAISIIFCLLGIASSLLTGSGLLFASLAQRRLLRWWFAKRPADYDGPGVMGQEPLDKGMTSMYFTPWFLLAMIFVLGWCAVLVVAVHSGTN